jgi:hypothetical protein
MKTKFEYMSMEELSRLMRNEGEDKTLREEAMRQLVKRENALINKNFSGVTRKTIPFDYGF